MNFISCRPLVHLCTTIGVAIVACSMTHQACAYGTQTHRLLSTNAARASVIFRPAVPALLEDLGLAVDALFPGTDTRPRTALDLIGFGSTQEDDQPILRMRNHFFDPQNGGRPLTILVALGHASPDWALEDHGPVPSRFFLPPMPAQKHSLRYAYRYLAAALTAESAWSRRQNFGLLFQSLGHAVHHVQDMAQPEHVRNDQHISGADTSYYEQWTGARLSELPLKGYALPDPAQFLNGRSFWARGEGGMAQFTARNFVSKDTNFEMTRERIIANADHPMPPPPMDVAALEKVELGALVESPPLLASHAEVWFLGTGVVDADRPSLSRFNPRTSTYSIFSADLQRINRTADTTLNRFNFAAAHAFLLPRAVAYSAGLIDYFFRGRLAVDSLDAANGSVTLKVRNVSAADFSLRERTDGIRQEFSMYYDNKDGVRRRLAVTNDDLDGQTLAAGATRTLSFAVPDDLALDRSRPFTLVFEGVIGSEPGIAALALDAEPLRGFVVQPSYLPADGRDGTRLIQFTDGRWQLSERTGLVAGNVDWRGSDPEDVLTWDGPATRYFFTSNVAGYSSTVYFSGRIIASAPGTVLGAAIRRAGASKELLVVTYDSGQIRLYKRPFPALFADERLYQPQANPSGWQLLHASPVDRPRTPFFFNGSAGEGQVIAGSQRVKLTLAADTVARTSAPTAGQGSILPEQQTAQMTSSLATPVGEITGPQECPTSRTAVCLQTTSVSCGGLQVDLCLQSRLETEDRMSARSTWRKQIRSEARPQVVCVDYRGDKEVLCTLHQPEAGFVEEAELDKTRRQSSQTDRDGCDEVTSSSSFVESVQRRGRALNSGVLSLRAGAVEIPLIGESFERSGTLTSTETRENGQRRMTIDGSEVILRITHDSRILYLDVRNGIAVYEDFGVEERTDVTASGVDGTNSSPQLPAVRRSTARSQIVAWIDGRRMTPKPGEIVQSQSFMAGGLVSLVDPHLTFSPQLNVANLTLAGYDCGPLSNFTDTWTPGAQQPDALDRDILALIHPRALGGGDAQGYAVDAGGRVVVSQPLWKRTSGGGYASTGEWSFISGGQMGEIVPPSISGATYRPLGLIR